MPTLSPSQFFLSLFSSTPVILFVYIEMFSLSRAKSLTVYSPSLSLLVSPLYLSSSVPFSNVFHHTLSVSHFLSHYLSISFDHGIVCLCLYHFMSFSISLCFSVAFCPHIYLLFSVLRSASLSFSFFVSSLTFSLSVSHQLQKFIIIITKVFTGTVCHRVVFLSMLWNKICCQLIVIWRAEEYRIG